MLAVEALRERYLWVDRLCIIQDDEHDLSKNIHGMHHAYSAAKLSIVAAGGDDANSGLPGLVQRSRDAPLIEVTLDGVRLVREEMESPLKDVKWGKCAW